MILAVESYDVHSFSDRKCTCECVSARHSSTQSATLLHSAISLHTYGRFRSIIRNIVELEILL